MAKTMRMGCCERCACGAPDPCCDGTVKATGFQHGAHAHRTLWGAVASLLPATRAVTRAQPTGATAYHHVGLGDFQPPGNHPNYLFGVQHRYAYNWAGGSGGTPWSRVGAEARELSGLSNFDLLESAGEPTPFPHFPAFRRTTLHDPRYVPVGDWPLIRRQGPEPMGLSDNEKKLGIVLALGAIGWMIWKRMGKAGPPGSRRLARSTRRFIRRNPANPVAFKYEVVASTKRRGRGRRRLGAIGFTSKRAAEGYADYLGASGHKVAVRKRKRRKR